MLGARRALTDTQRRAAADAITAHVLALPEVANADTVAAYCSIGAEPSTDKLLAHLAGSPGSPAAAPTAAAGPNARPRVLLPLLLPDRDLDWATYRPDQTRIGRYDLREPASPGLGTAAIAEADLVIVPALACSRDGTRLGRGGGSYDRALARLPVGIPVLALLYPGELLASLPREPHDRPVTHAVLPSGVVELGPASFEL